MQHIAELNLLNFGLVYLLLIIVLAIMKKARINQTKLLVIASVRMTVQLVLAGLILTYIFKNPNPLFTAAYLLTMTVFAIHRVLSKNKGLNRNFKITISASITGAGLLIVMFFIQVIVGISIFNPQYTIPISGMIIGNAMTGVNLAIKTFTEETKAHRNRINSLLNLGVPPGKILLPFVNNALETALLPTLNSMLGMGIISLPGMMTGQILSGTLPTTAILYQISIMIAICTAVCLVVFCSLYFGYKTLYNKKNQITI
jgi:putative ABC transport system permease protein